MEYFRCVGIVMALCSLLAISGCASGAGTEPEDDEALSLDTSHSTGEQCIAIAQHLADTRMYAKTVEILRECEGEYGVTVQLIPTFPDRDE